MNVLITLFVFLSYFFGSKAILNNRYRPSIYSRIIWLPLVINNFASLVILKSAFSVLLLAGLGVLGNLVIFILSLKKSQRVFGPTELISSILLVTSLAIWIFTQLPLLNLLIGLIAHFIGGIPTHRKVIKNPRDEDILFWLFFFIAGGLTLINIDRSQISNYLYPLYFTVINGLMTFLCFRRYFKITNKSY